MYIVFNPVVMKASLRFNKYNYILLINVDFVSRDRKEGT